MSKKTNESSPESPKTQEKENLKTIDQATVKKTADSGVEKTAAAEKTSVPAPVKRARKKAVKTATSSADSVQPVLKAYWGVFNPQMLQVAQYDYSDEQDAKKTADDLTEKKKTPHFIQIIKKMT
ncbi:MAG: hypothetical protein LBQ54_05440 [Planctomycetaceae bacterium]|jgi:hypothetical protein|nr:hypothetical protein [Planctomycetaceae bacterium]